MFNLIFGPAAVQSNKNCEVLFKFQLLYFSAVVRSYKSANRAGTGSRSCSIYNRDVVPWAQFENPCFVACTFHMLKPASDFSNKNLLGFTLTCSLDAMLMSF